MEKITTRLQFKIDKLTERWSPFNTDNDRGLIAYFFFFIVVIKYAGHPSGHT